MGSLVGLLTARGNDRIYTVGGKFLKFCHLIRCSSSVGGEGVTQLFIYYVGKLHTFQKNVNADRSEQFDSAFWPGLLTVIIKTGNHMTLANTPIEPGHVITCRGHSKRECYVTWPGFRDPEWVLWMGCAK